MESPADRSPLPHAEAPRDCPRCPRLVALRAECRIEHPDWWNTPVPAFGDPAAWLAIIGLAPGKHGANRTGRPFTGDYAGGLLYATLAKFGLSEGEFAADPADGLRLNGAIILNAVKCLPPQNKTLPIEEANCRPFLVDAITRLPRLTTFIAHVDAAPRLTAAGAVPPFFAGLLPEGRRLTALRQAVKTSADDELSLLAAVGDDTVGDVQVTARGRPQASVETELPGALNEISFERLLAGVGMARPTLAGVQDKERVILLG